VVRHTGLDITVYSSDTKRSAGHLSQQGPQLLRRALYEAAKCAARPAAPDHRYYTATRDRRTAGLATLSVARKLARRCYHSLRELGEEATWRHGSSSPRKARRPRSPRTSPARNRTPQQAGSRRTGFRPLPGEGS
jgi:Transposase IS116/IS110/IS902 family